MRHAGGARAEGLDAGAASDQQAGVAQVRRPSRRRLGGRRRRDAAGRRLRVRRPGRVAAARSGIGLGRLAGSHYVTARARGAVGDWGRQEHAAGNCPTHLAPSHRGRGRAAGWRGRVRPRLGNSAGRGRGPPALQAGGHAAGSGLHPTGGGDLAARPGQATGPQMPQGRRTRHAAWEGPVRHDPPPDSSANPTKGSIICRPLPVILGAIPPSGNPIHRFPGSLAWWIRVRPVILSALATNDRGRSRDGLGRAATRPSSPWPSAGRTSTTPRSPPCPGGRATAPRLGRRPGAQRRRRLARLGGEAPSASAPTSPA